MSSAMMVARPVMRNEYIVNEKQNMGHKSSCGGSLRVRRCQAKPSFPRMVTAPSAGVGTHPTCIPHLMLDGQSPRESNRWLQIISKGPNCPCANKELSHVFIRKFELLLRLLPFLYDSSNVL
jgi:hypothetical protein